MAKIPKISDAEWEVMQVVWQDHPISAMDVAEALEQATGWNSRTVKTMLGRLVTKGALAYREQGNRYLYRPKVSREACLRQESRSFLQRVFSGDPASLLAHFVDHVELSEEQLQTLRQQLTEKEKQ